MFVEPPPTPPRPEQLQKQTSAFQSASCTTRWRSDASARSQLIPGKHSSLTQSSYLAPRETVEEGAHGPFIPGIPLTFTALTKTYFLCFGSHVMLFSWWEGVRPPDHNPGPLRAFYPQHSAMDTEDGLCLAKTPRVAHNFLFLDAIYLFSCSSENFHEKQAYRISCENNEEHTSTIQWRDRISAPSNPSVIFPKSWYSQAKVCSYLGILEWTWKLGSSNDPGPQFWIRAWQSLMSQFLVFAALRLACIKLIHKQLSDGFQLAGQKLLRVYVRSVAFTLQSQCFWLNFVDYFFFKISKSFVWGEGCLICWTGALVLDANSRSWHWRCGRVQPWLNLFSILGTFPVSTKL